MRKQTSLFLSIIISISFFLLPIASKVTATEREIPKATSTGKIYRVVTESHFVMIKKADGKRVSLELTPESEVTLDGKVIPLDELGMIKVGFDATAEHFTNDSGMQRTVRLDVKTEGAP